MSEPETQHGTGRIGAQLLVEHLEAQGVEHIFAIPGAKIDRLLDVLHGAKPRLTVCRHEQNAGLIASGIGRMTGRAGVCLVTSGPGCSNLVTALATATYEGDPVVALGGAVPLAARHKLTHQTLDTVNLFRPVTKLSIEIDSGQTVSEVLAGAFRAAESGRPGAAFVSLPADIMEGPTSTANLAPSRPPRLGPGDAETIAEAARLINGASRPVLLLGMLASDPLHAAAVRRLLKAAPLPVTCTFQGAGVVSRELLGCFAGRVGLFHNTPADEVLDAADVVVTVGFNPIEYDPSAWNRGASRPIVHLDVVPAEIDADYRPAVEVIGDVADSIDALIPQLRPTPSLEGHAALDAVAKLVAATRAKAATLDGTPIHPLRLIHELQEILTDDMTVICDVGSIYIWMCRHFYAYQPRRFLASNGQQTMGVALPWAIAACLVRPGEKVVSMSGDGAFLMSAMELETAVRLKCNLVHLVWRDGSFDMVKIQQLAKYGRETAVELGPVDVLKYAEAFGATGLAIRTPADIAPTLRRALEIPGPVLIDVPVDYSDNASLVRAVRADAVA
ncbi:Acetolactate synthase, catabolic [Aquisphaera giovannonii]|uniref:Acetolactate synthase, catabolic n=1 Tax=Aquisphaera giovannonii TaxID=406548 RepID=A0A5B9WGJ6_9BACT|nr:acetolactate synthase AlsS [Aquisphaera giovannonii]QEH39131.1 Acetolactate synthase, catabolic [Aquisphaera giovannonii]